MCEICSKLLTKTPERIIILILWKSKCWLDIYQTNPVLLIFITFSANNYLFKTNNKNTRKCFETCSELTIQNLKRRYCCHSSVIIVNLEHVSHLFLAFLSLTLSRKMFPGFEHVIQWHHFHMLLKLPYWNFKALLRPSSFLVTVVFRTLKLQNFCDGKLKLVSEHFCQIPIYFTKVRNSRYD